MNRRNFMKTVALAVGVSPLAMAGRPETLTQLALDRGGTEVKGRVFLPEETFTFKGQPFYYKGNLGSEDSEEYLIFEDFPIYRPDDDNYPLIHKRSLEREE